MTHDEIRDQTDRHAVLGDPVPDDATFFREHYPWGTNPTYRLPDGTLWWLCRDDDFRAFWAKTEIDFISYIIDVWQPPCDDAVRQKDQLRSRYAQLIAAL